MQGARTVASAIPALALALASGMTPHAKAADVVTARAAPPFTSRSPEDWVGPPATWATLRGQVVLLHVWTFGCVNCVRTLPWYRAVNERYGPRGLRLIGVHTPEFSHEREKEEVRKHAQEQGLSWPHLLDPDHAYWDALRNQYWPATYLADRCGRLRDLRIGEVHEDQESGRQLQARIEVLLAEPAGGCEGSPPGAP